MDQKMLLWICASVMVVCALLWATWKSSRRAAREASLKKYGSFGERLVARRLRKCGWMRSYQYINDVYLPCYDSSTQIDHIVVGPFGVLVVETKNYAGAVYGNPAEKEWLQVNKGKRRKFYNPLMQNKTHVDALRRILSQEELYNIKVYSLVVFSNKKLELNIPPGLLVLKLKRLKKELRQRCYRMENGVDVKRVRCAILEHVLDRDSIEAEHNKKVKKASRKR